MTKATCLEPGCDAPVSSRGLCSPHYNRRRKRGTLPPLAPKPTREERFWSLIKITDNGCWEWQGALAGGNGPGKRYPQIGKTYMHRWSYERFVGPIPKGWLVCHKCDYPRCVNPNHLFVGTYSDNIKDAVSKGRWRHGPPLRPDQWTHGRASTYVHHGCRCEHCTQANRDLNNGWYRRTHPRMHLAHPSQEGRTWCRPLPLDTADTTVVLADVSCGQCRYLAERRPDLMEAVQRAQARS